MSYYAHKEVVNKILQEFMESLNQTLGETHYCTLIVRGRDKPINIEDFAIVTNDPEINPKSIFNKLKGH